MKMNQHINQFKNIKLQRPLYAVGLMSGTSVDAVDAALVRFESSEQLEITLVEFTETAIPEELRQRIFAAMNPAESPVDLICQLNVELGELFADAVFNLARQSNTPLDKIDFIASHGQTAYHIPVKDEARNWRTPSTLQLGSPSVIAARTGVTTVGDFRAADMAAGGVGAPLIPFVDAVLFGDPAQDVICQNIGGIANCTLLHHRGDIIAFDSGPGNMVMDQLMQAQTSQRYDKNGECAQQGQVLTALLEKALAHPYFQKAPPKATGREDFGEEFVRWLISESAGAKLNDLLATALELTASSITQSYQNYLYPIAEPKRVIVSGGGVRNAYLMQRLRALAPELQWQASDDAGVLSDAKEALGFAMLGLATLHSVPSNVPSVTKAKRPVVLGSISPGRGFRVDI
ncbi:MAG: anhydro-N-acetylmuramic acid kinase [Candidatus Hinthialibacter antarcticus]|nr:anhydro-N-acetylmuramic acid kinase [Candidatus Hinthialibacter antarcticus]